jgi:murein DD-endopeptidase MepM/ murein hydrolase activator NlpD
MSAREQHSWQTAVCVLLFAASTTLAQTTPPDTSTPPPTKKAKQKPNAGVKAVPVATAAKAPAQPKPQTKPKPKPAAKTQTAKSQPKPAVKSAKASQKKKAAPPPMKPGAQIPEIIESASVWQGCLESSNLPSLASHLGLNQTKLDEVLTEQNVDHSSKEDCTRYAALAGGEEGVASAVFERPAASGVAPSVVALRKTADGVTATPGICDCPDANRTVFNLPAREAANLWNDVLAGIPKEIHWQLEVLVPKILARVMLERTLGIDSDSGLSNSAIETIASATWDKPQPVNSGSPLEDAYSVRVILRRDSYTAPERLESIQITETATGKQVDGMWWLDRAGAPGAFTGTEGIAYERMLWQSPVKYNYKSRGVGRAVATYRQKVPAKKGSGAKDTYRYVQVRESHIGVDMVAPKGTKVHAVADATVAFAGRMGGYGNLIILDQGRGYQTYYAHLSKILMKKGDAVGRGEIIGLVGSTGRSTAPHLHFEMRKDGKYIDPFDETHQVEFWILSGDDQERLAMKILNQATPPSTVVAIDSQPTDLSPAEISPNDNDNRR